MLALQTKAPDFSLWDTVSQSSFDFKNFDRSKAYLVSFICNHCPYVVHLMDHLVEQFNRWADQEICVVAICSNDQEKYPADGPEKMKEMSIVNNFAFPYLHDEDQQVAKDFTAACTPDFFLFDCEKLLYYRGQYDNSRPGNDLPVTGKDLINAVNSLLQGKPPPKLQIPSIGCNVKWKSDNEPSYFISS